MSSIRPILPALFNKYRVMVYNGQYDALCGGTGTDAMLDAVAAEGQWADAPAFEAAPRAIWKVNPTDVEVAGYATIVWDNDVLKFARVIVRGAGHMLPADQPVRALDMITRFISGRGFEQ
jgi:vitellogenic carboxypeptidase-like protein